MKHGLMLFTCCVAGLAMAMPALGVEPCEACGPGPDWINDCGNPGDDILPLTKAEIGIYLASDCSDEPNNFVLHGSATIHRAGSGGTDTIQTEITAMNLAGGGFTLLAGNGQGTLTQPSNGTIVEQADDNTKGDSSFDVFFEATVPGIGTVWNHDPLVVTAVITCVPPQAEYIHPQGQCVPLYDQRDPGGGTIVAYLGDAKHVTWPVPAVSQWGVVGMILVILAAGTIMLYRARTRGRSVA
ncbi:MAG: hypothetical protein ACE5HE_14935 [Phycisphaerae bacterium]